jgi:lipoprotein-anchoring transpeptidase ErfK/SrfK
MRLFASSSHFRTLLAIACLGAMLACSASAQAEPDPAGAQAAPDTAAQGAPDAAGAQGAPDAAGTPTNLDPAGGQTEPHPGKETDAGVVPQTPKSTILVNIDKSIQEMTVFVDGVEQYTWPVSTGMRGYSTPSGSYTASSMNEIWYSKQWDNAPMPHAIFFTKKGHAIHGTLETKKLGKPASHGCVRISPENAAALYALVEQNGLENTQVVLTGDTPGGEFASQESPAKPRYGYAPWFDPGGNYYKPREKPRRFGRRGRWFQPYYQAPREYPPQGYYQQGPRGWFRPPGY